MYFAFKEFRVSSSVFGNNFRNRGTPNDVRCNPIIVISRDEPVTRANNRDLVLLCVGGEARHPQARFESVHHGGFRKTRNGAGQPVEVVRGLAMSIRRSEKPKNHERRHRMGWDGQDQKLPNC